MPIFMIVPFGYLCRITLGSILHIISWGLIYFIPVSVLYFYYSKDFSKESIAILLLSFCLIDMIYTNGYIQNDALTTKKEDNPTLRLNGKFLEYARKHIIKIFCIRFIITALIWGLIYYINKDYAIFIAIAMVVLQLLYIIYNNMRNIYNLFLIIPLSYIRFYAPILYIIGWDLKNIIAMFLLYQLQKFLEFSSKKRYKTSIITKKFINNLDIFRVQYYAVLVAVNITLYLSIGLDYIFIILALYYLAFRSVYLILLQSRGFAKYMREKREKANPSKKD